MKSVSSLILLLSSTLCWGQSAASSEARSILNGEFFEPTLIKIVSLKDQLTPGIIECLRDEDPMIRGRAADALKFIETWGVEAIRSEPEQGLGAFRTKAADALFVAAQDKNADVARRSIWALTYIIRPREFSHHGGAYLEIADIRRLAQLGKSATKTFCEILRYSDDSDNCLYGTKINIVQALGRIKDPSAGDALIHIVEKEGSSLGALAMDVLVKLGDPRTIKVVINALDQEGMPSSRPPAQWVIEKIGDKAVPDLIRAIENHPRSKVRGKAAGAFARIKNPSAIPALQRAAGHKDAEVRAGAASGLGNNPHYLNAEILVRLTRDEDDFVRREALISLGKLGMSETFEAVAALAFEQGNGLSRFVYEALPKIDKRKALNFLLPLPESVERKTLHLKALEHIITKDAEPELLKALESNNDVVISYAADYLGRLKSTKAIKKLAELGGYKASSSRKSALLALGEIGQEAADDLIKILSESTAHDKEDIFVALAMTGDRRAFELIAPYIKNPADQADAAKALGILGDTRAIPLLIPLLENKNWMIVRESIDALSELKATEAVPHLVKALYSEDEYLPSGAARALGKIGDPRATEALMEYARKPAFEGQWLFLEALVKIQGKEAIPILLYHLRRGGFTATFAAKFLGTIGDSSALKDLEEICDSEDDDIAEAAMNAMKLIRSRMTGSGKP